MPGVWDKIDSGLVLIYTNYLNVRRDPESLLPLPAVADGGRVHVLLRYQGDLRRIEQAGFETFATDERGRASGALHLQDLESIAERDEVLTLRYGSEPQLDLDVSVRQIRANKVWTQGSAPLYEFSGTTGKDVIIGIIDTGVDIHHPFLWRQSKPSKATRILRIWDMGLVPNAGETSPPVQLLDPLTPGTYGVEYTRTEIDRVIKRVSGARPIRHRDCSGHGTHVASIAAGDGRFDFKLRGVAPRADLVIVKLLFPSEQPSAQGVLVNFEQRFRDAVTYIRNIADGFDRPVVINYSVGSDMGPHDGLTESEDWLSNEFSDDAAAGKIFVTSAGNEAGTIAATGEPKRHHARIVFSRTGTVDIPFELFDHRTDLTDSGSCTPVSNTVIPQIQFYYPADGAAVTWAFKPRGAAAFRAGPALSREKSIPFSGRAASLSHGKERSDLIDGTIVERKRLQVIVPPDPVDGHLPGDYVVRLTASKAVTVHVWCSQNRGQGFRVKEAPAMPPQVIVEDRFLINSPGTAANAITVAAYSPDAKPFPVAGFSSRGPVARHGDAGGAAPAKPDIAAPGVKIHAAKSRDILPPAAGATIEMGGTSMAAPHVAGVVALMLQKNPSLTPSQVRTILRTHALTDPIPEAEEVGAGRLDAKAAVTNTPKP